MLELIDDFCWNKHCQLITADRHQIPGLKNFAHWNINRSTIPTPLHIHSHLIEFHCMVKGKRFCEVDNEKFPICGNEVLVTFPQEVHSTSTDPQTPNEFYALQLDVSDPGHVLGLDPEFSGALCASLLSLRQRRHRRLRVSSAEIKLLRQAFDLFSALDRHSIYHGTQYLGCFLFLVPQLLPAEASCETDPQIEKALSYIEENACRGVSLEDLAEVSCLSLSRFKAKFKAMVGHTPAEYITLKKVECAKRLLAETDRSITDIAFGCGFASSNYFCSVFRRVANCSPTEYRRARDKGRAG